MKVLVLGATGGTGREVVAQGLERGHDISVFVRDPARLGAVSGRLTVIPGDIRADPEVLATAVAGQDAVISALGAGNSLKSSGLITYRAPLPSEKAMSLPSGDHAGSKVFGSS